MNARELPFRLWAQGGEKGVATTDTLGGPQQVPRYSRGRLDIGPFIVLTRKRMAESAHVHMTAGALRQREDPTFAATLEDDDD